LFQERAFLARVENSTFEFFSKVVLSRKIKWNWELLFYNAEKTESQENNIHYPLFFAVRHGYIEHARVFLRAKHPHHVHIKQFEYSIFTEVKSFSMFQMLIEEGVPFYIDLSHWPCSVNMSLDDIDGSLTPKWLQYMIEKAKMPPSSEKLNMIISFVFLKSMISNSNENVSIQRECIILLAMILSHAKTPFRVYDCTVHGNILKKYQNTHPFVCGEALFLLSLFGIFKLSTQRPLFGIYDSSFIYKLSVRSQSFVDALIERGALKEKDDDDSTLFDDR
jgi:hypothetical protein